MPSQMTEAEAAALAKLKETVEDPVMWITISQTIGNLILAYGLKYLWKMINLF